LMKWLMQ